MPSGKKRKRHKMATHKRKKRLRKNRFFYRKHVEKGSHSFGCIDRPWTACKT